MGKVFICRNCGRVFPYFTDQLHCDCGGNFIEVDAEPQKILEVVVGIKEAKWKTQNASLS